MVEAAKLLELVFERLKKDTNSFSKQEIRQLQKMAKLTQACTWTAWLFVLLRCLAFPDFVSNMFSLFGDEILRI